MRQPVSSTRVWSRRRGISARSRLDRDGEAARVRSCNAPRPGCRPWAMAPGVPWSKAENVTPKDVKNFTTIAGAIEFDCLRGAEIRGKCLRGSDLSVRSEWPHSLRVIRRLPVTWQCGALGGQASDKPRGRKPRAGMRTTVHRRIFVVPAWPRDHRSPPPLPVRDADRLRPAQAWCGDRADSRRMTPAHAGSLR